MASSLFTEHAPRPIGPYSQGIKIPATSSIIYVSGQIPIQENGELLNGTIEEETKVCLRNVEAVLKAGGASLDNVIKTTVFLADMSYFPAMNFEYLGWFNYERKPARSCVAVKELPKGARVEIECIAAI